MYFLIAVIVATAAAYLGHVISRAKARHRLHALATELKMAYSPYDRFGLADRVADRFPIPGAASLRISDLLYASNADGYRYIFSAEYTLGVIRSKSRVRRVAAFSEPKNKSEAAWTPIRLAPENLSMEEQYQSLAKSEDT